MDEMMELLKAIKHATELNAAETTAIKERLDRIEGKFVGMAASLDRVTETLDTEFTEFDEKFAAIEAAQERHERLLGKLALGYVEHAAEWLKR